MIYDLSAEEYRQKNIEEPITVTAAQLEKQLVDLGVAPDMKLVVHSALSSLGNFTGGANALCIMLMNLLGREGLLMMPSFSLYRGLKTTYGVFDYYDTPSLVGTVTEHFRKMPGVIRSLNPSHSMAVWGNDKLKYVKDHHKMPTMHHNSPLGLLEQQDGSALLISCPETLTFMHVVEFSNNVPCLGCRNEEYPVRLPNGKLVKCRTLGWRNGSCRALRHDDIYNFMRKNNSLKECMFHRAHLMLFKLSDYRIAYERLLNAPKNGCRDCPVRPRKVACNLASDWDKKNNRLKKLMLLSEIFILKI